MAIGMLFNYEIFVLFTALPNDNLKSLNAEKAVKSCKFNENCEKLHQITAIR